MTGLVIAVLALLCLALVLFAARTDDTARDDADSHRQLLREIRRHEVTWPQDGDQ